jgi:GMP synthase-like glutamine amidotransferase
VRVLVLQHIACEPPGVYEDVLRERGADVERIELDEGHLLPDWRAYDLLVAMGGPMSANDDRELPWLAREKSAIRAAVEAGKPYFGVCLGAQLLAASLGARVYPGLAPEVGLLPVSLTEEGRADPVFADLPGDFIAFQWHRDTFDLPAGASLLAVSPAYPNQAFCVRSAYGMQFHLEVSAEMADEWASVPAYASSLERTHGPGALPRLLGEFAEQRAGMEGRARAIFERFLETTVEAPVVAGGEPR